MQTLLKISSRKSAAIRNSTRTLFLLIGFSLIVMAMLVPPVKSIWLAWANILGVILVLFSIVGLSPRLKLSGFGKVVKNKYFHIAISFVMGIGIIAAVMYNPPIKSLWFAYFNLIGGLLVFDALLTTAWHTPLPRKASKSKKSDPQAPSPAVAAVVKPLEKSTVS